MLLSAVLANAAVLWKTFRKHGKRSERSAMMHLQALERKEIGLCQVPATNAAVAEGCEGSMD
jgi:hypothetical protein